MVTSAPSLKSHCDKQFKAVDVVKQLVDGQQVRVHIPSDKSEGLYRHECCECGLKHNLYVGRIGKDVTLAFVRTAVEKDKARKCERGG